MAAKSKSGKSGTIVSLLRPRKTEAIAKIAKDFLDGKNPNLNTGIISKQEYDALRKARREAKEQEKKVVPTLPYIYSPVIVQIARKSKCDFATQGQKSKHLKPPSNWPKNVLGAHEPGMKIDPFRSNHAFDVRKLIIDSEENVKTIAGKEYVVGTVDKSAVFLVNSARSGNYEANIRVAKQLSLSGIKELANLVALIGSKDRVERFEDGQDMVWLPYHEVVWGYLEQTGKQLPVSAIRKLDEKVTGVKFIPLKEPIVGQGVAREEWWKELKKDMSAASTKDGSGRTAFERFKARKSKQGNEVDERGWVNLTNHQTRISPTAANCLGLRNVQLAIPPFTCYSENAEELLIRFMVGCRLVMEMAETKRKARRRVSSTTEETTEPKQLKKMAKKKKAATPKITDVDKVPEDSAAEEEPVTVGAEYSDDLDENEELIEVDAEQRAAAEHDFSEAADEY